jgi:hypothetical protein
MPSSDLGLQESSVETAEMLRMPAVAGDSGSEYGLLRRASAEWLVLGVEGQLTVLVAARNGICTNIRSLFYENKMEGSYKENQGKKTAVTKLVVVEVTMQFPVKFLGNKIRVLNVHLHRHVAKKSKGFAMAYEAFWTDLADYIRKFDMHVLMGDFNMALWQLCPELHKRGIKATVVAWFPWKCKEVGKPMRDFGEHECGCQGGLWPVRHS